jgi:acyl-CoA thioesterase
MTSVDLELLRKCFGNDRFAASSGVELVEVRPGYGKARLVVKDRHLNGVDIVQGGAIFTLADFAFALACNSSGHVAVAVNVHISFMKATSAGVLEAEATEISRSRRISTCTVRVTREDGELVALFQGTAYIKDEPFPPKA